MLLMLVMRKIKVNVSYKIAILSSVYLVNLKKYALIVWEINFS